MHTMMLALALTLPQDTTYLKGGVWHQGINQVPETLVGHSAGAHSALSIALQQGNQGKIKCVVLISGVYEINLGVRLVSHGAFRGINKYDGSPIYHIPPATQDSPAFALYYASHDIITLRSQTLRLANELRCKGYRVTVSEVRGNHHNISKLLGY